MTAVNQKEYELNKAPEPLSQATKHYSVGTLVYTRAALVQLFFWMLWGDFCLSLMEQMQSVIPLQLKWEGASDKTIGFISGSLMAIVTVIFNPSVAVQSDRHRGPLGRRRPFLLWCTPPIVGSLCLLGYSKPISCFIYELIGLGSISVSQAGFTIFIIGIFAAVFYFFNIYIMQVYQYLFADVIPKAVMGKFVGLYRAIGALSGFCFNYFLFGYIEKHTGLMYVGLALIYSIAFLLLVWKVKEGQYPQPDVTKQKEGIVQLIKLYVRECFSNPFYLKVFSTALLLWSALVPFNGFIVFYATDARNPEYAASLGLSLDAFGKIKAWTLMLMIPFYFLSGPLIDRFHPLRIVIAGLAGACITFFLGFVFAHNAATLLVLLLLNAAAQAILLAGYLAMLPRLLPSAKYGQFFSANQIFFCVGLVSSPLICGWFLELIKNYKYIFIWAGLLTFLSLCIALSTYFHWLRLGGDKNYIPPE